MKNAKYEVHIDFSPSSSYFCLSSKYSRHLSSNILNFCLSLGRNTTFCGHRLQTSALVRRQKCVALSVYLRVGWPNCNESASKVKWMWADFGSGPVLRELLFSAVMVLLHKIQQIRSQNDTEWCDVQFRCYEAPNYQSILCVATWY
jgi:hypothetical protein